MREYQFDPFRTRARDKCTIGALRSEAADVDVAIRSMNRVNSGGMSAASLAAVARPAALDKK